MPIERADQHRRVVALVEIAGFRPDEHSNQRENSDSHMRHVQAGDGEIERSISARRHAERFSVPFETLDHEKENPENDAERETAAMLPAGASAHAALAPPY